MNAPSPTHPAAVALDSDPRTQLENALRHLRHANRCTLAAIRGLGSDEPTLQRATLLSRDICAAAQACAGAIDHLDGFNAPAQ
jgi:hypothetical protein